MSKTKKKRIYIVKRKSFPFLWLLVENINPEDYYGTISESTNEKNEEKLRIGGRIAGFMLIGLLLLILSFYFKHSAEECKDSAIKLRWEFLEILVRDCSIAIISAALITLIIEVPNFINFMNARVIESLTNYNYLNYLNERDLEEIKKKCSRIIFRKKGKKTPLENYQNESILDYEAEISKLLLKPYYDYYKLNFHCEDVELIDSLGRPNLFMKKITKRHFKIVNPVLNDSTVDLFPPILMHCPDNYEIKNLISIEKFIASIDGYEKSEDLLPHIEILIEDTKDTHPNYNKKIKFVTKNNTECVFPFKDEITIEIEDIRYVAHSDPFFVTRVNKPCKTFSVNYSYNNPNYRLKIEGFNINANLLNGKIIKVENGNTVSFDILTWMLPGNGIVIATIPKEKDLPYYIVSADGQLSPLDSDDNSSNIVAEGSGEGMSASKN